jgi:hypothetical protein
LGHQLIPISWNKLDNPHKPKGQNHFKYIKGS